ncbi:hypothetical protein B0H19DRAFT_1128174 [Mycena capillaripes]|nr:hypothetical protein B0H19DRAFT_1128174 [Mycena capillaripes]
MQYATVRHTAPAPIHGYSLRARRNTMEPSGRQHQNMIQLVKASQRQQYAHEYIDDRSSFVRAQQVEEERIQQDMERAMRAQRRNKARQIARTSKVGEQTVHTSPVDHWRHGGNVRRPSIGAYPQPTVRLVGHVERGEFFHSSVLHGIDLRRPSQNLPVPTSAGPQNTREADFPTQVPCRRAMCSSDPLAQQAPGANPSLQSVCESAVGIFVVGDGRRTAREGPGEAETECVCVCAVCTN